MDKIEVPLDIVLDPRKIATAIKLGENGFELVPSPNYQTLFIGMLKNDMYSVDFDPGGPDLKEPSKKTPIGLYITTAKERFFIHLPDLVRHLQEAKLGSN